MRLLMVLGVILAAFVVFAIVDSKEMERQNCQRTGNSRDDIIWQYITMQKVMLCQCILRLLLSMNINAMTVTGGGNNA